MKILVTGSNGQVGNALKHNSENSHHEFCFTDRTTLDIGSKEAWEEILLGFKPKIIINAAAYTAVDKAESDKEMCEKINAHAVQYLCEANEKLESPAFIIHLSTDYVYHPEDARIITEEQATNPQNTYALTKLQGEEILRESGYEHVIVRTSWVYDETGHNFVNTMDRLGGQKESLNVVSDQVGSPTYAGDIAELIFEIVNQFEQGMLVLSENKIFNFSNMGFTNWADFAREIMRIQKHNCVIHSIPTSEYPTPAKRPLNSRLSKSKVKETLGIDIPHWKQSLRKCLENRK